MIFRVKEEKLKEEMGVLLSMPFKADVYCPSGEDIRKLDALISDQDVPVFEKTRMLAFLLWVDATGTQNKENAAGREVLQSYLREHLCILG